MFHIALTDFNSEYLELQKKYAYLSGQQDVLKMLQASANSNPVNEYQHKAKSTHTAKQYNLMRLLTGSGPMLDDTMPSTDGLKYYSGSTQQQQQQPDKSAAEKRRKAFELMRFITGC